MMGIGATVGAGIFVLLGFALGAAGPAILLAILLNGIVAGLNAATYADLGTTFPEAGGGFLWVHGALPYPLAFATGWMMWFCHMVAGTGGPPEGLASITPAGSFGVLVAMTLPFIAFQGLGGLAQAGEEVRLPERTIPRAMFLSLGIALALYLAIAYVALAAKRPAVEPVW